MSTRFLWTGLTLVIVGGTFNWANGFAVAGAIIMAIGTVLMWLGK